MMKVHVKGKTLSLTKHNYKSEGGEGQIFVKKDLAFKIYFDPQKMISAGKIQELAVLTDPKIIKPEDIIFNNGTPIGYTMRFIKDAYSFVQTFTKAFKNRHGLYLDTCLDLVQNFQKTVHFIHSKNILIVDLNEMNFLVDKKFKEVYCIDVDSYQTPNYKATAIMESIRDRHTPSDVFNEGSDWFSFAIITFQLLTGIHPYKGKHKNIKGLDARMSRNISVFNPDVSIPRSAESPEILPTTYRDWYYAVFEKGLREAPPVDTSKIIPQIVTIKVAAGTNNFKIKELFECVFEIHQYAKQGNTEVIIGNNVCINRRSYQMLGAPFSIGFYGSLPIAAKIEIGDGSLIIKSLRNGQEIKSNIWKERPKASQVMSYKGRFYYALENYIYEIQYHGSEFNPHLSSVAVANILSQSAKIYPGCVVQNLLGTCYVSTFPESQTHYQYKIEDFKGYRLIDAKFENNILMLVGEKQGIYTRFIYTLQGDTNSPTQSRKVEDISYSGLNFTVLDNGICVLLNEQEQIEIFHQKNLTQIKVIEDKEIHGAMRLFNAENSVLFSVQNKLFSMTML